MIIIIIINTKINLPNIMCATFIKCIIVYSQYTQFTYRGSSIYYVTKRGGGVRGLVTLGDGGGGSEAVVTSPVKLIQNLRIKKRP